MKLQHISPFNVGTTRDPVASQPAQASGVGFHRSNSPGRKQRATSRGATLHMAAPAISPGFLTASDRRDRDPSTMMQAFGDGRRPHCQPPSLSGSPPSAPIGPRQLRCDVAAVTSRGGVLGWRRTPELAPAGPGVGESPVFTRRVQYSGHPKTLHVYRGAHRRGTVYGPVIPDTILYLGGRRVPQGGL